MPLWVLPYTLKSMDSRWHSFVEGRSRSRKIQGRPVSVDGQPLHASLSFSHSARHCVLLSKGQNDCKPKSPSEESSFSVGFGKMNGWVHVACRSSGDGRYAMPCRDMTGEGYSTVNSRSKVPAPNSPFSGAQEIQHSCCGLSLGNICWPKVIFLS